MTFIQKTFTSLIMTGGLAVALTAPLGAVVAKPGLIEVSQPDGTIVMIRLEGDAFHKRAYTTDGYLLTTNEDGFYVFAECGSDGLPAATRILASEPAKRSTSDKIAVSRLDQSKVTDAFRLLDVRKESAKSPAKGPGLFSSHFPSHGEQHAIAILVEFSNNEFTIENPNDYFTRQLNEEGFSDNGGTGSARDYFVSNSYGGFLPTFDVYGPVKLSHPISYYGSNDIWGNDKRAHEMIIEACQMLDEEIDFTQYDRNNDGVIDNVYVYYAGFGEADGGGSKTIWPHSFDITSSDPTMEYMFDGVQLDHYACSNELENATKIPTGIGTFTHEFSHVMGLPDLYATDNSNAFTPGEWNILDVGSYNNNSCTPPNYSSFERYALGWMEPEMLTEPGEYVLEDLNSTNKAFIVPTEEENEYFLFENRQNIGNDRFLPGHGMLVWHIDFVQKTWDNNIVNNNSKHQHVDLVEADNKRSNHTRAGDPFPGSAGITEYTFETKPAFQSWGKLSPGLDIVNIAESEDGVITFTALENNSGIDGVDASDMDCIEIDGRMVRCLSGVAMIYDLSGRKVAEAGASQVALSPGLYIMTAGGQTRKVVIN